MLLAAEREIEDNGGIDGAPEDDPLLAKAIELAREHETLSTSMLQRKLRIGYPRAARTMDELEDRGIVGSGDGTSSRRVLLGDDAAAEGGRTLAAEAADFEPVPAGGPPEPPPEATEERDPDGRKVLQFPKAFDDD
jgi:S-DNA-T family DNA segregation ATPase FtsK/SpoIIIE